MKRLAIAALLSVLAGPSLAARPWFMPSMTVADGKEPLITVDAAVSDNLFEFDKFALKIESATLLQPDGSSQAISGVNAGRLRASFDLKLTQNGTYKISLVTRSALAMYQLGGEQKRWTGPEDKLAAELPKDAQDVRVTVNHQRVETFVSANGPSTTALKPTGEGLEFAPVSHPNELHAGEKVSWRFLINGKPAANMPFSLVPGNVRYRGVLNEQRLTTDANGEASLVLPEPGMYWLGASVQEAANGAVPARRFIYAATLEILPQ